jgi:hypothetical protein
MELGQNPVQWQNFVLAFWFWQRVSLLGKSQVNILSACVRYEIFVVVKLCIVAF